MKDRIFIDTNIFVYAFLEPEDNYDKPKHFRSVELLNSLQELNVFISIQVLNEFYNSLLKYQIADEKIQEKLQQIIDVVFVSHLTLKTIKKCWEIKMKYRFSYYDSLIIASALENDCLILYTEDMQHGQIIEKRLKIINPFVELLHGASGP